MLAQRILVVDDDREMVRTVRGYLEKGEYEVLVAHDGETALQILRSKRPDLVLLDLRGPGRDEENVTRAARDGGSLAALPLIMLTTHIDDPAQMPSEEPNDSMGKQLSPQDLPARVRSVLRRAQGAAPSPQAIRVGTVTIDVEAHRVEVDGQPVHLTPTEFALLRTLAEHPGRALTRLELIEEALGYSYEGVERTVDSHVKNLRRKLGAVCESTQPIETVFGIGYRLAA